MSPPPRPEAAGRCWLGTRRDSDSAGVVVRDTVHVHALQTAVLAAFDTGKLIEQGVTGTLTRVSVQRVPSARPVDQLGALLCVAETGDG